MSKYHRRQPGELDIIVTQDDIAMSVGKYPKNQGAPHHEHRPYIADRFAKEHGVVVLDFTRLKYLQSKCQTAILVRGKMGEAISRPLR